MFSGLVCVHLGAGYHSIEKRKRYEKLIRDSCQKVIMGIKNGDNALSAVTNAVCILENCPFTNAGTGSNLTIEGNVEMDASIMDGSSLRFGAVGALGNIQNPILVARAILEQQINLSMGRVAPCLLAGEGAKLFAAESGFKIIPESSLITAESRSSHNSIKRKFDRLENQPESCKKIPLDNNEVLDTVGAICIDLEGNIASAVSSGGIQFKKTGRIGQAATFGAGSWAQLDAKKGCCVGISTSGVGEHLIKTMLAEKCARKLFHSNNLQEDVNNVFEKDFLNSPFLKNAKEKLAGAVMVKLELDTGICELICAHTTRTMCFGFVTGDSKKPRMLISTLTPGLSPGHTVCIEGNIINLLLKS